MSIRILYSFSQRLGIPGIGMTAFQQVASLARLGHEVIVCAPSIECELPSGIIAIETLRPFGLRLPHRAIGRLTVMKMHDVVVSRLLRRIKRPDVLHCWPSASARTISVAKGIGIPALLERPSSHTRYVYDVTMRECDKLGVRLSRGEYSMFSRGKLLREEIEFQAADYLVCPSDFAAKTHMLMGISPERIMRHNYGYDPESYYVDGEGERPESVDGKLRFLYVGYGTPLKGLHVALEAWQKSGLSESSTFTFCGDINEDYRRVLSSQLEQPGVEVLGFSKSPSFIMRESDVLILPSFAEGSALVTYESMASGCALLVSDAAGAPIEHGVEGLIHDAGDVSMLVSQMQYLQSNPQRLKEMKRNGLTRAQSLTWTHAGARLLSIYQAAIGARA